MKTIRTFALGRSLMLLLALALGSLLTPASLHGHSWSMPLEFTPPAPGTYELPVIKAASDGEVLDSTGATHRLFDYLDGKIVLLSFIYSRCGDARGCPLATVVLHATAEALQRDLALARQVRLLSLSFDPEHDTPDVMQRYASGHAKVEGHAPGAPSWHRLTTSSPQTLQPILDGYGQYIQPILDAHGGFTGTYSHVLKVFLIDRHRQVRNIYSVDFLHPEVVINDIKTSLMAEGSM